MDRLIDRLQALVTIPQRINKFGPAARSPQEFLEIERMHIDFVNAAHRDEMMVLSDAKNRSRANKPVTGIGL